MNNSDNSTEKKRETSYSKLTEEQRKKKIKQNQEYIKRDYTICAVKIKNTDFEAIDAYMQASGAASRNKFIKECIWFAIDKDFKGIGK